MKMLILILLYILSSCSKYDFRNAVDHDPKIMMSRDDFRNNLIDSEYRDKEVIKITDETFEDLELIKILDEIDTPELDNGKLVSISVTEDVPLRDVLIELGRLSDMEMEIDPTISGGIILMVKDRPFFDIIKQISSLAKLRYSVNNGILRIERDTPYIVNYSLDFLDSARTFNSTLSLNTGTSTDSITTGSDRVISSSSDSYIWNIIIENLANILSFESGSTANNTAAETNNNMSAPPNSDNVAAQTSSDSGGSGSFVTSNQKAGIITVSATASQHKYIEEYINRVRRNINSQVLIEAKIVEVSLYDEFQAGIDWSSGDLQGSELSGEVENMGQITPIALAVSLNGRKRADIKMLEKFGTTRTLSSPRITAVNNQQAILTFTENKVYFEVSFESDTQLADTNENTSQTIDSEMKTIPIGVILALQPSINLDTNEILINIRPTISSISASVDDPAAQAAAKQLNLDNINSKIPQVKMKEIDTILRIKSGSTMVIGGLIEHVNENVDIGIPFISKIPLLGYIFKSTNKKEDVKETVIFITATILESDFGVTNSDNNFYKNFTNDNVGF
jgi:MSHA type pilus biogenesis protein MshL